MHECKSHESIKQSAAALLKVKYENDRVRLLDIFAVAFASHFYYIRREYGLQSTHIVVIQTRK